MATLPLNRRIAELTMPTASSCSWRLCHVSFRPVYFLSALIVVANPALYPVIAACNHLRCWRTKCVGAVRDCCLCLHVQPAARALARRFDEALRPVDLTNGQFSLLMSLNRPAPPAMADVASLLAMDRTTLTAALKPLERRELVTV